MKITILYGGKSGEHEVSLVSAASVARNIDLSKHTVDLIGITKEGKWFYQDSSELERIKKDTNASYRYTDILTNELQISIFNGNEYSPLIPAELRTKF